MEIGNILTLIASCILVINIILAIGVLFFERREVSYTLAWLMVLFFLPIVGFVIYIFFGRKITKKNFYGLSAEETEFLQTEVDQQLNVIKNGELLHSPILQKHEDVVKMNLTASNSLLTLNNHIDIYDDGHQKFDALLADIQAASKEVNVQYYIIQPDNLGKRLRDALTEKAKQGVKVRVLYDEIGSKKLSLKFFQELREAGGEVEVFFPSILGRVNFRINNRNHRKLCIIDGKIAYIGGFNVGDEYLGLNKKFGYWRDTHLRITGQTVDDIQGRFILDWHQAGKGELWNYQEFCFQEELQEEGPLGESPVQIVSSGPNSKTEYLKNMYIKLILSAKESVCIQTPYFIPDTSFMDACKMALLSGVDVRIMIPCKPDHPFVYWATWSYVGDLLDYGAKVLLYENGFLHAKTIVVDQEVASVGTMNIDSRSFRLNFEVNAIVYDEQIAKSLYQLFEKDTELTSVLTKERYQNRSILIKIKEGISRLLSPIL
ncbi:cardiolipin synthase [Gracilibacillus alcaliphilus]|uniref:cardiolipin synthase n=1 Tax=Gracilibacillus alcaliphilus TaxID=1401441 RepID=UPI00195B157D|nr:cardiolipin synthase [Gracilibacillus alcaliphilus]MBM7679322.1 cardiolipin synthase [Gracilibacillus alcaliphilus]